MKNIIFALLLLLVSSLTLAQLPEKAKLKNGNLIINDTLWIGQHEVTVKDWYYTMQLSFGLDGPDGFDKMMPDTTLMPEIARMIFRQVDKLKAFLNCQNYYESCDDLSGIEAVYGAKIAWSDATEKRIIYFTQNKQNPNLDQFKWESLPITGVSFDQVMYFLEILGKYDKNIKDHKRKSAVNLKPTLWNEPLWKSVSSRAFFDDPQIEGKPAVTDALNAEGCRLYNIRTDSPCKNDENFELHFGYKSGPCDLTGFYPDAFGILHFYGNVAEMTNRSGEALGGSYAHRIEECIPGSSQSYEKPEQWLGFRIIYLPDPD